MTEHVATFNPQILHRLTLACYLMQNGWNFKWLFSYHLSGKWPCCISPLPLEQAPKCCTLCVHARHKMDLWEKAAEMRWWGRGRRMVTGKLLVTGLSVGLYFSFTAPLAASSLIPSALLPTRLCLEESANYSASLNLTVSIICFLTLVFCSHPSNSDLLVFAYLFSFAHRLYSLGPDS